MLFREKVALITGGAAGFGRSFAESLASEGARIVLLDIDETQNQRTAEILTAYGADCLPLSCDVSDEEGVNRCVELAAKAYGKIDILINNAGRSEERRVGKECSCRGWTYVYKEK